MSVYTLGTPLRAADGEYSNPSDLALGQTVHAYVIMLGGVNPYRVQVEAPTRQAAEALAAGMRNAQFVLIPASEETRGHGTHSAPVFWKDHLVRFLAENQESPD